MNALDTGCIDAILQDGDGGCHCFYEDTKDFARIELAALRAEVTALQQAVDEARQSMLCAMDALDMEGIGDSRVFSAMREWLAAHPAPEQVTP